MTPTDAMPAAPRRGPARWPLVLAIVLSAVALLMLFWLRSRLAGEERNQLANAVRVFEELILRPENEAIDFSLIETTVRNFRDSSDFIAEMLVSKRTLARGEILVHPFHHELLDPDWREAAAAWERLAIGDPANPDGWLYVRVDPANRRAVDLAIGLFALFLVVCLGVLVFRTRGKEMELSRTVSELEERRAEVIRLERLALAGQLSANILHDIKKPILNIKHEVHDNLDRQSVDPELRESLEGIRRQTELFLGILRELGIEQFVRAGGEEGEYCDVADSIDRSLALVKYERGDVEVELEMPRDGSMPLVFAPPHRLVQLFSNLILNAYQAMEGRGLLAIKASAGSGRIVLRFADSGPGVPEEMRARIFDPFVTSKGEREGSGLGLYICAQIARDLGGRIELERTGPTGTTFLVVLPAAKTG